mgnify:CR=1 FL=1
MSKVSSAFAKRLEECVPPERIASGEPLSKHTTFQIGGPAEYFVTVSTAEELGRLLALLREVKKPYFPIGRGSNLLVGDKGFRGVVFRLAGELETCKVCGLTADTGKLIAGAGVSLAALANAGNYEEALAVIQAGLAENPSSSILQKDLNSIKKLLGR